MGLLTSSQAAALLAFTLVAAIFARRAVGVGAALAAHTVIAAVWLGSVRAIIVDTTLVVFDASLAAWLLPCRVTIGPQT